MNSLVQYSIVTINFCFIIFYYYLINTILQYTILHYIVLLKITVMGGSQIPASEGTVDVRTEALRNGAITGE